MLNVWEWLGGPYVEEKPAPRKRKVVKRNLRSLVVGFLAGGGTLLFWQALHDSGRECVAWIAR